MTAREGMRRSLRRSWLWLLIPSATCLAASEILRSVGVFHGWTPPGRASLQVVLLVLAAATALALPILYRAAFASAHRKRSSVPAGMFYRFANNVIVISLITPYLSLAASVFGLDLFFAAGIFLLSLYAVYTQYPSEGRLDADLRTFRVEI
jgi:hypothetical protein